LRATVARALELAVESKDLTAIVAALEALRRIDGDVS
jgi:hypothetical protein